jgi:hypothetical protein
MRSGQAGQGPLRALLPYDCWALLESAHIARIAWAGPDLQVWPSGDRALFVRVAPETVTGRNLFGNGS